MNMKKDVQVFLKRSVNILFIFFGLSDHTVIDKGSRAKIM